MSAVPAAIAIGLALVVAASDPPPRSALARPRLEAVPASVIEQCRLAQAATKVTVLCPRRLPRASIAPWSARQGTLPPTLSAQHVAYLDRGGRTVLETFGYGAPFEPGSGTDWRQHLWRNRPCCFLHFEVMVRVSGRPLPATGGRPTVLGGRRGVYLPALGNRITCGSEARAAFWCNHAVFVWRQRGVQYAATLHSVGSGTRALLSRLVAQLRPVPPATQHQGLARNARVRTATWGQTPPGGV